MPTWLAIQGGLLLFWYLAGFVLYRSKLWKVGFPLTQKDVLTFLFIKIIPCLWLLSSLIFGLIYHFVFLPSKIVFGPFIMLIVLPSIVLLFTLWNIWFHQRNLNVLEERKKKMFREAELQCKQWLDSFPFLTTDMIDLTLHMSNNKPMGRIVITEITREQSEVINERRGELPEGVKLWLIPLD